MIRCVIFFVVLLSGCAAQNQVERLAAQDGVTEYKNPQEQRFGNLYPGKKAYPFTCSENCYPTSPQLTCEQDEPAENCQFVGQQSPADLDLGISFREAYCSLVILES